MDASEKVEIVEEFYRHPMMKEFQGLMKKTNTIKPKKKYVERLQEMLNACPTLIRICMNSAQQACESLIKGANATGATKEFWRAEMVDLKSKLSYRESTELEKLLIEQR